MVGRAVARSRRDLNARLHRQALVWSCRSCSRGAGVLPAGAHRARRSAGLGAAAGRLAGTRRADAQGLRLRPAAAGAVRPLGVERAQRRSRHLDRHRPLGRRGSHARGRQHRDAGGARLADRLHVRPAVRLARRLFPRHLDRQARDLDRDRRRVGAALLARHGAGDHLLGAARLAARGRRRSRRLGVGLGAHQASDPAGDHDVGDPDGHRHPHRARAGRRYA